MANKNNPSSAFLLVLAPIAILLIIFIKALPYLLIGIAIFFLVIFIRNCISDARFYNRENCLLKIGNYHYLDRDLTNQILLHKDIVKFENNDVTFKDLQTFHRKMLNSKDIKLNKQTFSLDTTSQNPLTFYNIAPGCTPLTFRFLYEKKRSIVFYIIQKKIFAFAEGKKSVFIGAYNLQLLKISCSPMLYPYNVIVYEKNQNPIEYYYKFSPVQDAPIVYCNWAVTNKDGSRSFKGGLLPEHNPLKFKLRFARVNYQFGQLSETVDYSDYNTASKFSTTYAKYTQKK